MRGAVRQCAYAYMYPYYYVRICTRVCIGVCVRVYKTTEIEYSLVTVRNEFVVSDSQQIMKAYKCYAVNVSFCLLYITSNYLNLINKQITVILIM